MSSVPGTIVFCRNISWDDPIRINTHCLAAEFLADGWRTAWLSRVLTPWRFFYPDHREARRNWRLGGEEGEGIFEYSPLFLAAWGRAPVLRSVRVWRWSGRLTVPGLRPVLERRGFFPPEVFWIGSLALGGVAQRLKPDKIVYQAHDAFSLYPDVPVTVREVEGEAVKIATVVVCTSEATRELLRERYPEQRDKVYTVTHGVHLARYEGEFPEPEDLKNLPRPRAVLLGSLDLEDEELIAAAGRALRQVSFVLIGPGGGEIRARAVAEGLSNVHLLGPKAQGELPAYLKNCEVGLIAYPFRLRDSRRFGTNPMKRYEYAAAGLPTVSVDLREYQYLPSPLYRARNEKEFVEMIAAALEEGHRWKQELSDFARANTWREKYRQVLRLLGKKETESGHAA